jgi:hypothetical protein
MQAVKGTRLGYRDNRRLVLLRTELIAQCAGVRLVLHQPPRDPKILIRDLQAPMTEVSTGKYHAVSRFVARVVVLLVKARNDALNLSRPNQLLHMRGLQLHTELNKIAG